VVSKWQSGKIIGNDVFRALKGNCSSSNRRVVRREIQPDLRVKVYHDNLPVFIFDLKR